VIENQPGPADAEAPAAADTAVDWRFDVTWFAQTPNPPIQFGEDQFEALNERGERGHYLVMPTAHRMSEARANGNVLCAYVNDFNGEHATAPPAGGAANAPVFWGRTAADRSAEIQQWYTGSWLAQAGGESRPDPAWIFLNEISRGTCTANEEYPAWVAELAARLEQAGFTVVVFSPFTRPAWAEMDWAKLRRGDP